MDAMERALKLEPACCDAGHNPCDESQQRGWPTVCHDCLVEALRAAESDARAEAEARALKAEAEAKRYLDVLLSRHGGECVALIKELDEARALAESLKTHREVDLRCLHAVKQERDEARAALATVRREAMEEAARVVDFEAESAWTSGITLEARRCERIASDIRALAAPAQEADHA